MLTTIAIIGNDAPATGWAARALAYGLDVLAAPGAELAALCAGVEAAWPALEALGLLPGARRDRLRCAASLAELAHSAQLIVLCGAPGDGLLVQNAENGTQTSADERGRTPAIRIHPRSSASAAPNGEQLPNELLSQLDALAPPETPIVLAGNAAPHVVASRRSIRAYAAEPAHLLPLAELSGDTHTAPAALERAEALLRAIGLEPVRVAPGGVAGRLLAALDQAAHALLAEGCDRATIDAVIAQGPGLLAPLAGAPAAQRDEALIAIMRTLRQYGLGAGQAIAAHEARRYTSRAHRRWQPGQPIDAPLELHAGAVEPAWIDYNGHMTEASYLTAFGDASDALFRYIGIDEAYRAAGGSFYTVETHINYYREVGSGEPLRFTTQLLGLDAKRLHMFHSMLHGVTGALLCTTEQLLLHVDTRAGAAGPIAPEVHAALSAIVAAHAGLPVPSQVGRQMGIRRKQ